jgi:hypothetical protein
MKRRFNNLSLIGLLSTTLLFGANVMAFGQMSELETDQGIDASIAPYNADVREAILQVSQYPQVLSQLQTNQSQTVESFHDIINGFDRKKQAWFYTITRYPELMLLCRSLFVLVWLSRLVSRPALVSRQLLV